MLLSRTRNEPAWWRIAAAQVVPCATADELPCGEAGSGGEKCAAHARAVPAPARRKLQRCGERFRNRLVNGEMTVEAGDLKRAPRLETGRGKQEALLVR